MSARQVRRFQLERDVDVSGVSGTGAVAFGAQAPEGTCVLWWASGLESTTIYPSMETLLAVHGHGGLTRAVYIDPDLSAGGLALPGGDGGGAAALVGDPLPEDLATDGQQDETGEPEHEPVPADDEPAHAVTRAGARANPRSTVHQPAVRAVTRALRPPSRWS